MTGSTELTADEVRANTVAVDITDEPGWLAAARWEVAVGYSKLANPKLRVRMRDIYTALCEDGYDREGRSRTIAAVTTDPRTGTKEIAALARVVFGRPASEGSHLPPIDSMNFMRPDRGWPHDQRGLDDAQIAEIGRFTIIDKYRDPTLKEAEVNLFVGSCVFGEAIRLARQRGAKLIYSIAPAHVADLIHRAGYRLREIPAALRTDNPEAVKVFEKFNVYWRRLTPTLYEVLDGHGAALAAFQRALSDESILSEPELVESAYGRNVSAIERQVPFVLRPGGEDEVRRIIAIANESKTSIYPFSTGKNWGLGSKLPVADGCVVVDLSRMNRINHVSEEFAYARIEPGVTQLQLARYLRERHPSLTINFTGSFAHIGIVGNVLDRGDGAHARVDDLLGVRGILGGGEPFAVGGFWETRGGSMPGHVSRFVAGADLCGLFCQSNFGIVTEMAFRLVRKPEARFVLWGSARDENLEQLVKTIGHFTAQGAVNPGSVNIGYANRFVQARQTLAGDAAPPPPVAGGQRDDWNFYILIGGTARSTAALADEIGESLRPLCLAGGAFRIGARDDDHDDPTTLPPFLQPLVAPLLGMPDAQSIRLIYELTGTALPADEAQIDADHTPFGMKCYIPVVPPQPASVRAAATIVDQIRREFALNVKVSFFGDGRTLITIHFLTTEPQQVKRAETCERAMWDRMTAAGFWPYRVSIDQMDRLVALRPQFFQLVRKLKSALDPNGIISPGRYCPA